MSSAQQLDRVLPADFFGVGSSPDAPSKADDESVACNHISQERMTIHIHWISIVPG